MASYVKFYQFTKDLIDGVHDFDLHTFKVLLTNTTPTQSMVYTTEVTEVGSGNGYTTGGNSTTITTSTNGTGTAKATGTDPATWTASGGTIGPFRYAVFYNVNTTGDSPMDNPLIAYWDYGSAVTLQIGETFTVDLDAANGVFTVV